MGENMVRPEDLEKMLGNKLPEWLEQNPVEKKPDPIIKSKLTKDELVHVTGVSGFLDENRAFCFYRNVVGKTVIPEDNVDGFTAIGAPEMTPLGKYPGIKSQKRGSRIWAFEGNVLQDTIIKVFIGYTLKSVYGMEYLVADTKSPEMIFYHPDETQLHVRGNLKIPTDKELNEVGIARTKSKNFTMIVPSKYL